MRKRSSSALVLACISFGWLAWVRQRADGADQTLAALRLEIASLTSASEHRVNATDRPKVALAAELKVGAIAAPAQNVPDPTARTQPQVTVPEPSPQTIFPLANAGSTQAFGQQAAVATGRRGECTSHPVVFWHYPKTGMLVTHFVTHPCTTVIYRWYMSVQSLGSQLP